MRATALAVLAALAPGLLAGCGQDYFARQIIEHNADAGRLIEDLTGTGDQLIKQKRIDVHREFTAPDKIAIDVWVIRARSEGGAPAKGTALLLHGLTESKARYLRAGERLAKMGYDVVLPDLRAHGRSGGKYVTFGALEKYDLKTAMDDLISGGTVHRDIYVFGATLGAATAIQYAAIEPRCKGVVAMTPYKDVRSIGRRMIALLAPTMSNNQFETVLAQAGELGRFDPEAASSEKAAATLTCPLLLVHGMFDLTVPLDHSQAIYAAAKGPKKLLTVTPGPEQVALAAIMDRWIAEKIDTLATTGLPEPPGPREPAREPPKESPNPKA